MSQSLYWKPHKPDEMKCLNKCVPLMATLQNVFFSHAAILTQKHVDGLFWLAASVGQLDSEMINDLIFLIKEHGEIEIEIRW